jgi:hypothetical protein
MNQVAERYAKWRAEQKIVVPEVLLTDRCEREPDVPRYTTRHRARLLMGRKAKR